MKPARAPRRRYFRRPPLRLLPLFPLLAISQLAHAETITAPAPGEMAVSGEEEVIGARPDEILVVGSRLLGTVDAAQPPLVTLSEADIASYGASSLTELLAAVAPQTGSGRGRGGGHPVILMNGQRISNFREMQGFSPEAVRRMEVLPEEVALRYGFPPNQRVINFILKDNFSSQTIDGEYNVPTRGGFAESEATLSMLRINGASRLNLNAYVEDTGLLTEAERGIIQPAGTAPRVAGDPDPAGFRSLIADSRDFGFNGSWSRGLGERGMDGSLSANLSYARNDSRSLSGLDSFVLTAPGGASALRTLGDPLERVSSTDRYEGGAALNKRLGPWQMTLTLDGGHVITNTATDRRADTSALVAAAAAGTLPVAGQLPVVTSAGADRARVANDSLTSLLTMAGNVVRLPAGEISATFKAGFAHTAIASSDSRLTGGPVRLKRGDASAGINFALPITSRRENALAGAGDITLNFSAGLNHLSDFGTLNDWSAGLTWGVTEKLSLQASYIVNEAAPSLGDLGNPAVVSLNVPVYDFARGENALVAVTSGGIRSLQSERQRDLKFSANWQLPISGANLIAEYFRNRSDNVTAAFPLLTPAIEAAFPGRATRDAAGRLVAIDRRPVTFSKTEGERLRWGINLSGRIGKAPPERGPGGSGRGAGMGGPGMRGPGAGGPGGGGMGRMMGMMGGGGGQGRWNLSAYHTVRFAEQVMITPSGPLLDLLAGDALSGGGVARHSLEIEGGAFRKGFGLRVNGNWSAPTRIKASGAPGTSDLRFGSVFRLNLRVFSDLGNQKALTDISPVFKGMRLAFQFDNIFDSRQKVTDASGATPFSYLPDYLDPKGRVIGIDLRKSF
jgi:hypothetical protein